jgi:molecular chaperone GrpE
MTAKPEDQNPSETPDMAAKAAPAETSEAASDDPKAALEAEIASLKDRLLRTLADMENQRRRAEKDVADARAYAVTNFARDMVNVADNLRRAIESVPADSRQAVEGALKSVLDGVELTERDLLNTLERHGIKRLDPAGQKFDPNFHQAMMEVQDPSVPAGTVTQVIQTGFAIGERVLRPALVGVAKGGPKDAPAKPDAASAAKPH